MPTEKFSGDFASLHSHADTSAFDGLGSPEEFLVRAAEMGQKSFALTDHGSLRGLYAASVAAEKTGVKLIPGLEAYVCDDASLRGLTKEERDEIKSKHDKLDERKAALKRAESLRRERDHITIWALDNEGLRNLYKLNAYAWTDGFYYRPRIDLEQLKRYSAGLAVSSGCPGGIITSPMRQRDASTVANRVRSLAEIFGDRLYIEIMPHVPTQDCVGLAEGLLNIAEKIGAKVVATQDAHYPRAEDSEAQDALLCIQTHGRINDPIAKERGAEGRFGFDSNEYWLRSRAELRAAFEKNIPSINMKAVDAALDATLAFADRCTARIDRPAPGSYLAAPELPEDVKDYDHWLLKLCAQGVLERGIPAEGDYMARLEYELGVIKDKDFGAYFVMAWDVRKWAREQDILCGPGRGSAAGSLVGFLLKITDLDPIESGLSFERFIAPGRESLPDIDLDFESGRGEEIVDYLRDTYGHDHVAQISTHTRLGGKAAVHDLGRVFQIPSSDCSRIASLIFAGNSEESQNDDELARVLETTETGKAFAERYPDAAAVARRLEGNLRSVGRHPGGVIIADRPIVDLIPLESTNVDGQRVLASAYDMRGVEASGFVKLDVLRLKTLKMLRHAFQASGTWRDDVDYDDPDVRTAFNANRFAGVFQCDTPSTRRLARNFTFKHLLSSAAVLSAVNRPGPMLSGLAQEFFDRAAGAMVPRIHPLYDEVFKETYGVPVYQEQVMALTRSLCGYSAHEADEFRIKVAKKKGLEEERQPFVEGAVQNGMPLSQAESIFESLCGFAAYAFNKSHSYCYAALSIWCMWLKVHCAPEFYAAALQYEDKIAKRLRLAAEARRLGIPVEPPSVQFPSAAFSVGVSGDKPAILGGLSDVKGVGPKTAMALEEEAPFSDLVDLRKRAGGVGRLTGSGFKALARASALRDIYPDRKFLALNSEVVWKRLAKGQLPKPEAPLPEYEGDDEAIAIGRVWPLYQDVAGRTAFDGALDAVVAALPGWDIAVPALDDDGLDVIGPHMVLAKTAGLNVWGDGADRSGRATLISAEGDELQARLDADVIDQCAHAIKSDGSLALCLLWLGRRGSRHRMEMAWPVDARGKVLVEKDDVVGQWLVKPPKGMTPSDPWRVVRKAPQGRMMPLAGIILRGYREMDSRSGEFITRFGLLGPRGYVRVNGYSPREGDADVRPLRQRGSVVQIRARRLRGVASALADTPVRLLSD